MIITETTWRRALRDSESFRRSGRFFWGCEVLGAAIFAALATYFFLPRDPSRFESFYPLWGVVAGFASVYMLIYLWNLFRAPYRQRNEALTRAEEQQSEEHRIAGELSAEARTVLLAKHVRMMQGVGRIEVKGEVLGELRMRGLVEVRHVTGEAWSSGRRLPAREIYYLTDLGDRVLKIVDVLGNGKPSPPMISFTNPLK